MFGFESFEVDAEVAFKRLKNGNVSINGTLVVNGNLTISGAGNTITAVKNYPALVVNGDLSSDKIS